MNPDVPLLSNEPPASGVPSRAQAEPVTVTQPVPAARSDSLKGAIVSGRSASRLELEPMDPQIKNIQPGGGVVIQLELAWGRLRRWYLKSLRPNFVARMRQTRRGDFNPCPHEVLDPRDLKFYRNQGGYFWEPQDDPFLWRDHLPFARVGLAELIVIGGGLLAGAILCFLLATAGFRRRRRAWCSASWPCGLVRRDLRAGRLVFSQSPAPGSDCEWSRRLAG